MSQYGVIYARYSAGPGQTDQSIEGQLRDCKEYADKHNITIIDTYIDRHISGTDFENRVEFNRLIKDAEKHQFTSVIVWKIDRFGRNRQELALNKVRLKKHNIKLLYAKENIPDGPEGIILESLLEGMAEYYSAELAQKVRRGQRESMLKGHILNGNPLFGYNLINKRYVINPDTAPIVTEIFEKYKGGDTIPMIRDDLNQRHIPNVRGTEWKLNNLYEMLSNEKYIGIYRYGENVLYDTIPPIVDPELFNSVQIIRKGQRRNKSRTGKPKLIEFILTGKLYCGYCKDTVIGESGTGRNGTHYYYKCAAKKNKHKHCDLRTYRKHSLEECIIKYTLQYVLVSEIMERIAKKVVELQNNDSLDALLKSLKKQEQQNAKSIKNIMNAIEMGIITETTKERLLELEQQREEIKIRIAQAEIKRPEISYEQVLFWLEQFKNGDIEDYGFCFRLINTFIHSIYLYNDHIIVAYNFCDENENRESVELAVNDIEKNRVHSEPNGSSEHGHLPQTGIEPVRSLTLAGF